VPVLETQHAIAGTQRIDQRSLPPAGPAAWKQHGLTALSLENGAQVLTQLTDEGRHRGSAVVRNSAVHGAQHSVRDVRRSRDLKEVAAG
jgi:hypothetical protein